jgi:hypothetical protein
MSAMTGGVTAAPGDEQVLADTRQWIERAVIGLNLCPFARSVYVKNQVRIVVSRRATSTRFWTTWTASWTCW